MKKIFRYGSIILVAAAAAMLGGCNYWDDIFETPTTSTSIDTDQMTPSTSLFVWGGYNVSSGVTRTLIDQITTRTLDSNFLRIDETIGANNVGAYTFQGWNKATMLEATVISSPDNTPNIHYRAVTFAPTQTYSIFRPNATDTTFYHTRLVGWYPRNCTLQRNERGKAVTAPFEDSRFNSQRVDLGGGKWGVRFDKVLDGRTDLMMSNLREGEQWHKPFAGEVAYAQPFGHNEANPTYANPISYRHYLSVVRIWAYASDEGDVAQNLLTWGNILGLTFVNQPTSCTIQLPDQLNQYGTVVADSWDDFQNIPAVTSLMYGAEDINHQDDDYEASYPIDMTGHLSSLQKTYLGYCLVQPNNEVEISIRTNAAAYNAILPSSVMVEGASVDLFQPSKIYDFTLSLKTSGTMEIYIQNEDVDNFTNLSPWNTANGEFETANTYVITPNPTAYTEESYPGYCFCANIIGNGDDGLLHVGSTSFHTASTELQDLHSAELVWESTKGLINNIQLQHGYIRFQLPGVLNGTTRTPIEGNAVIAVKDESDNVLWSWHIWITDSPQNITYTLGGGSTLTIMDRNLGATAATFVAAEDNMLDTYGLYYQWGRKDPSPGPSTKDYATSDMGIIPVYNYSGNRVEDVVSITGNNTLTTGIQHPFELLFATGSTFYQYDWLGSNIDYLWGYIDNSTPMQKTIYDPCPYGYRVAANELQNLFALNPTYTFVSDGGVGGLEVTYGGITSFFPCAGYKGPDRGLPDAFGWHYVGLKGDYMGAVISATAGVVSTNHRNRSYLSTTSGSWTETSVPEGNYSGFATNDFTNRKTAASVRCVKMQ